MPGLAQRSEQAAQGAHRHDIQPVGGLVQHQVARPVHERAGERGLDALPLREALGAAVGEFLHLQEPHELGGALARRGALQAVQRAEVQDVLARRQVRIDAGAVRQHPEAPGGLQGRAHRAVPVDERIPRIGPQHRVQHAQRGGLAGAVGPEEPGDAAVRRAQTDVAHGRDRAEVLVEVRGLDHGRIRRARAFRAADRSAR